MTVASRVRGDPVPPRLGTSLARVDVPLRRRSAGGRGARHRPWALPGCTPSRPRSRGTRWLRSISTTPRSARLSSVRFSWRRSSSLCSPARSSSSPSRRGWPGGGPGSRPPSRGGRRAHRAACEDPALDVGRPRIRAWLMLPIRSSRRRSRSRSSRRSPGGSRAGSERARTSEPRRRRPSPHPRSTSGSALSSTTLDRRRAARGRTRLPAVRPLLPTSLLLVSGLGLYVGQRRQEPEHGREGSRPSRADRLGGPAGCLGPRPRGRFLR